MAMKLSLALADDTNTVAQIDIPINRSSFAKFDNFPEPVRTPRFTLRVKNSDEWNLIKTHHDDINYAGFHTMVSGERSLIVSGCL